LIDQIQRFLDALDKALISHAAKGERLDLYPLGRAALILLYGRTLAQGATKDFDVVQISHPLTPLGQTALDLFGQGTDNARNLGLYLEMVPDPLPPVPAGFQGRCQEVKNSWQVIRLWRLEVHDLAATKLKCFRPQDREDLQFLCDTGRLKSDKLKEALEKAFIWDLPKDGDPGRDRAFENLERVNLYLQGKSPTL
jgi:hypothetical protein